MVNTLMPFSDEFTSLRQAMDRLMNDAVVGAPFWGRGSRSGSSSLPLAVYSTADDVVLLAAAPGMNPQQLDVSVHQGTVTISGTIPNVAESEEAKEATWYIAELPSGQFSRSLTLPFPLNADQAKASYQAGIIKIVIPKAAEAKPKKIAIANSDQSQQIAAGS